MSRTAARPFGHRLAEMFDERGALCVGIDPHAYLLEQWGLPASAAGVADFGLRVIEACAGVVGIIKPQVAFFERFGADGYRALEDVLTAARSEGILVIADAKRGDLGSTLAAYADAWLTPGAPLEADAVTLSPYLGLGSLEPALELAHQAGKGVFVLAATSNAEARTLQTSVTGEGERTGKTVAGAIASEISQINAAKHSAGPLGSIGVVLGATVDFGALGVDLDELASAPGTPVLAPGFGHQGAAIADVRRLFGAAAGNTVITASRSILDAGPTGIADAVHQQKQEVMEAVA